MSKELTNEEKINEDIANKELDTNLISDGYHTFGELYEFRKIYNAALFNQWAKEGKYMVHKSKRHSDGEPCFGGGWFIVVAMLPTGMISNHYEMKDWNLFHCDEYSTATTFDGHTPNDVITRIQKLDDRLHKLSIVEELQETENIILTGSFALELQGVDIRRDSVDLDFCMDADGINEFEPLKGMQELDTSWMSNEYGREDEDVTIRQFMYKGIKIDILLDEEFPGFGNLVENVEVYHTEAILGVKAKYAMERSAETWTKHRDDVQFILNSATEEDKEEHPEAYTEPVKEEVKQEVPEDAEVAEAFDVEEFLNA